jgi:hypothetical protein
MQMILDKFSIVLLRVDGLNIVYEEQRKKFILCPTLLLKWVTCVAIY